MADRPKAKLRELPLEEKLRLEAIHEGLRQPLKTDNFVVQGRHYKETRPTYNKDKGVDYNLPTSD
jgi:hypothetical protein